MCMSSMYNPAGWSRPSVSDNQPAQKTLPRLRGSLEHQCKVHPLCTDRQTDWANHHGPSLLPSQVNAVPKLLALIDSSNPSELSRSAAAAIASISVCREGKYAIAATPGGLHILTALVSPESDPNQCAYALEAISNAAEAPEARKVLAALGALDKCTVVYEKAESLSGRVGELLRHSAAEAIRQVGFSHLPHALLVSGAVEW